MKSRTVKPNSIEIKPTTISRLDHIHFPAKSSQTQIEPNPLDLVPICYEVKGLNREVYLSNIYAYSHYPVIFAYIKDDEGNYQPRLLYFSRSHSIWRVAPVAGASQTKLGAIKGGFGKGYGEFSCDLPTHFNLAMLNQFQNELLNPRIWIKHELIEELIDGFSESSGIVPDASTNFLSETKRPTFSNPIYHYEEGEDPTFVRDADAVIAVDEEDLPDVETLEKFPFVNPYYDEFNKTNHPLKLCLCSSKNGNYQFLFLESSLKEDLIGFGKRNKQSKSDHPELFYFLLTASKSDEKINSFGVSPKSINLGYLHVTPIMREHDIKALVSPTHPILQHSRLIIIDKTSNYLNLANYTSLLPINRDLKNKLLQKTKLDRHSSAKNKNTKSTLFQPINDDSKSQTKKPKEKEKKKTRLSSFSLMRHKNPKGKKVETQTKLKPESK